MTYLRIVSLAFVALLALPAVAAAKNEGRKVTVMTRNVYLGADLAPVIEATSLPAAIDGAGTIWNEMQSTRFRQRAVPLAREIKRSGADLVGLQEVALWRKQTPSDLGAPPLNPSGKPATQVEFDFLAILRKKLKSYRVVVVQKEFEAELPVDQNGVNEPGTLAGEDFDARLTMRDVILVRRASKVQLGKKRKGNFDTKYQANVGPFVIPVDRGWTSVEARLRDRNKIRRFRFVNTHLEAFGEPTIREAQAKELIAGPLDTSRQLILVGDLNSGVARHNEPEQPGDDLAFRALAGFGMKDKGAVQSCCYADMFDSAALFDHTVDHVLTKPGLRKRRAFVTGDDRGERTPAGLWPSDHGGVVSRLLLRR